MTQTYSFPRGSFVASSGVVDLRRLEQEVRADAAITIALDGITASASSVSIVFRAALPQADQAALNAIIVSHSGEPLPDPIRPDGVPIVSLASPQKNKAAQVAIVPTEGSEAIYSTIDFCDPCSWYCDSSRVTDHVMTDSGDGLTWTSSVSNWIDLRSGRVQDERGIREEAAGIDPSHHLWDEVVTVDGEVKTRRRFGRVSGGDYVLSPSTGEITFFESQAGKDVRASFSHAETASWYMTPLPGRYISIIRAEVQFCNVQMMDGLEIVVQGLASVYAPQLGLPAGMYIDLFTVTEYEHIQQLIDEAEGAYAVIPAMGGPVRGNLHPTYGFPFKYAATRVLRSRDHVRFCVRTMQGTEKFLPLEGAKGRATATFYCVTGVDGEE